MKKIALALVSFVVAAACWAALYAFFFSAFGKDNYVAVIATYGVLPVVFLTKIVHDSVRPPERLVMMGTIFKTVVTSLLASAMWGVILLFGFVWSSQYDSIYDDNSLAPFAVIVLLPPTFLAKVIYDALKKAIGWEGGG